MDNNSNSSSLVAILFGVLIFLVALMGFGYYEVIYLKGPGLEIQKQERINERKSNEQSQQYFESQVRGMRDQISQYNANTTTLAILRKDSVGNKDVIDAMVTQQRGIVTAVRNMALTVPGDVLPYDISAFLSGK